MATKCLLNLRLFGILVVALLYIILPFSSANRLEAKRFSFPCENSEIVGIWNPSYIQSLFGIHADITSISKTCRDADFIFRQQTTINSKGTCSCSSETPDKPSHLNYEICNLSIRKEQQQDADNVIRKPSHIVRLRESDLNHFNFFVTFAAREVPLVLTECEQDFDFLEHSRTIQHKEKQSGQESLTRAYNNLKPDTTFSQELLWPKFVTFGIGQPKLHVLRQKQVSDLTRSFHLYHRSYYIYKGEIEVYLCDENSQRLLYINQTSEGIKEGLFEGSLFKPDYARYPNLRKARSKCQRNTLTKGMLLYLPSTYAITWKGTKETRIFEWQYVDAINYYTALDRLEMSQTVDPNDQAIYKRLLNATSRKTIMENFPKESNLLVHSEFFQWQKNMLWNRFLKEITPEQVHIRIHDVGRSHITMEVMTESPTSISRFAEIEYRRVPNSMVCHENRSISSSVEFTRYVHKKEGHCWKRSDFGSETVKVGIRFSLAHLMPNEEYVIKVRLISPYSGIKGPWNHSSVLKTSQLTKPGLVSNVSVEMNSTSDNAGKFAEAELFWIPPHDDGGFEITDYIILWKEARADKFHFYGKFHVDELNLNQRDTATYTSVKLTNFSPGKEYLFRVAAINQLGIAEFSTSKDTFKFVRSKRNSGFGNRIPMIGGDGSPHHHHNYLYSSAHPSVGVLLTNMLNVPNMENILQESSSGHSHMASVSDSQEPFYTPIQTISSSRFVSMSDSKHTVQVDGEKEIIGWSSHHSPKMYDVHAQIMRSNPPDACSDSIEHADLLHGRILIVDRGGCPLYAKAALAKRMGAVGVIIVDVTNRCDEGFENRCMLGSSKSHGDGFSAHDDESLWKALHMPCIMIKNADGLILEQTAY